MGVAGGTWRRFVRRHGWRAYALPILTVITLLALMQHTSPSKSHTTRQAADSRVVPTSPTSSKARPATKVNVEGLNSGDAAFAAGATPGPVTINLGNDTATSCADNTYPQLVLVSISKQHMWACDHTKQVEDSPVTTGRVVGGDQTPQGSWRVQAKQRDRYLVGPGYRDYVQYWVPFNGDFGLHDASWQTMPFGSAQWTQLGSHGCVHTPTTVMAWIYRWVVVGQTVVTIEH